MGCSSISVRGIAAIAAVCALFCVAAASASAAPLAVVANRDSGNVSLVNTTTNQIVGSPIETGELPGPVAITPDGRYAYVADRGDDTVVVIDLATKKLTGKPIEVGDEPYGLAITPDGSRVLVTDSAGSEVSVIDTRTREVVGEIPTAAPAGIAVSPDGRFAYVTNYAANSVEVIDVETMEIIGEPIKVGNHPVGVEFTPDGSTAYVVDEGSDEVSAIDTATRKVVGVPLKGNFSQWITLAPDGTRAFVVNQFLSSSISVIDTETNEQIDEFPVGVDPQEAAVSANGKVLYVTENGPPQVERFNAETGTPLGSPIPIPGEFSSLAGIAIAPDQSPTPAFTAPSNVFAGSPATFSGAASTDPDGSIVSWKWAFGDGGTGTGPTTSHAYKAAGTYSAKLSVIDNEGCGEEVVFTGRTAYCSGSAPAVHPVTVNAPAAVPIAAPVPSNRFAIKRIVHNRRNGTVRMQVKLPSAGFVLLFGNKVHAVTRKSKGVQTMWLTLHARVELAKRLKKILRAPVRFRITFTPNGGTAKTVHRTVTLQRAPHRKRSRH